MSNKDNFKEFINVYLSNIQNVSSITMMNVMGKVEKDLINSDICWMVTDNIKEILSLEKEKEFNSQKR